MENNKTFSIEHSHPVFSGHFINDPLVPGVMILEQVILKWQALENSSKVQSIDYAKFINPLRADTICTIEFIETRSVQKKEFMVKTLDKLAICKGRLVYV